MNLLIHLGPVLDRVMQKRVSGGVGGTRTPDLTIMSRSL